MADESLKTWSLRCRDCGDRVLVVLPETERETAGSAECMRGHTLSFRYDGVAFVRDDPSPAE